MEYLVIQWQMRNIILQNGLLCIIYVAIIISYKADELIDNLTKIGSSNNFNLIVLKDGDKIGDSRLYYIKENGLINLSGQLAY